MKLKVLIIILMLIFSTQIVVAHKPFIVSGKETQVTDPHISKAYYGYLDDKEHTYTVLLLKNQNLYVNILAPDKCHTCDLDAPDSLEFKIFKVNIDHQIEIFDSSDQVADWQRYYEEHGKDHYYQGIEFDRNMSAGNYKIVVKSDTKNQPYTLAIGKAEDFKWYDYITAYAKAWYLDFWFFK